jgi:hypothetical protein
MQHSTCNIVPYQYACKGASHALQAMHCQFLTDAGSTTCSLTVVLVNEMHPTL